MEKKEYQFHSDQEALNIQLGQKVKEYQQDYQEQDYITSINPQKRKKQIKPILNQSKNKFNYLYKLPQTRWIEFSEKFRKSFKRKNAFKIGFIIWLISFNFSIFYFAVNKIENLENYISAVKTFFKFPILIYKQQVTFVDIKTALTATIIPIIVYFIISLLVNKKPEKVTPYPPEVNLDNLNNY